MSDITLPKCFIEDNKGKCNNIILETCSCKHKISGLNVSRIVGRPARSAWPSWYILTLRDIILNVLGDTSEKLYAINDGFMDSGNVVDDIYINPSKNKKITYRFYYGTQRY